MRVSKPWKPSPWESSLRLRLLVLVKAVEDVVFQPGIWVGVSSPVWGIGLGFLLGWPLWLTACVALAPLTSLLLAGALHSAFRRWTHWLPVRSAQVEVTVTVLYLAAALGVSLTGHYLAGW